MTLLHQFSSLAPAKKPPVVLKSVGVQTELSHVSISTQTQRLLKDQSAQTSSSSKSVSVQVDLPSSSRASSVIQTGMTQSCDVSGANETARTSVGLNSKGTNGSRSLNLLIVCPCNPDPPHKFSSVLGREKRTKPFSYGP